MNASEYKKHLIKLIQINKKNVFVRDEDRKEFMKSRFNCESLKDMTVDGLIMFLDFCRKKVSDIPLFETMTTAQEYKIRQIWKQKARNKEDNALATFVFRLSGKSIDTLSKKEATKILIALDKMISITK